MLRHAVCPECGYEMRGLRVTVERALCPECGSDVLTPRRASGMRARFSIAKGLVALAAGVFVLCTLTLAGAGPTVTLASGFAAAMFVLGTLVWWVARGERGRG